MNARLRQFLLILCCWIPGLLMGQSGTACLNPNLPLMMRDTLDSLVNQLGLVGVGAAIRLPDGTILAEGSGYSTYSPVDSISPAHRFAIGSVTKTLVSTVIFQLVEEDSISLDDSLDLYLPPYQYVDSSITIRQLLSHTSGVYNYSGYPGYTNILAADSAARARIWTPSELLDSFMLPPVFAPGQGWGYSNSNYLLLAEIIEAVTGNTFHTEIENRLLTPLGLNTVFHFPIDPWVEPTAHLWWDYFNTGTQTDWHDQLKVWNSLWSAAGPAGGYFSTPSDMAEWIYQMQTGGALDSSSLATARQVIASFGNYDYATGLMGTSVLGIPGWGHTGDIVYHSATFYFPQEDLSISVHSNDGYATESDLEQVMAGLMQVFLSSKYQLLAGIQSASAVSCFDGSDGMAVALASGGIAPYSYSWSTSTAQTGDTISGLAAGSYQMIVSDAGGCTDSVSFTIEEPAPLNLVLQSIEDISCFGSSDGVAFATASGGTAPYSFLWQGNGSASDTVFSLGAGSQLVTVTDTNGCLDTDTLLLTQPQPLNSSVTLLDSISCFGGSDGVALATASGGTAPYSFLWQGNGSASDTVLSLGAGLHSVLVTDSNACTDTVSFSLSEPLPLVVLAQQIAAESCSGKADASAFATASGGSGSYSFEWIGAQTQIGDSAIGLSAGMYSVVVTDANACTDTSTLQISAAVLFAVALDSQLNLACFGDSNGWAQGSASGGQGPYSYLWNNNPNQTDSLLTGLSAGNYQLLALDVNGCSDTLWVTIAEPPLLQLMLQNSSNVSCFGFSDGSATASVQGGSPPWQIDWATQPPQSGMTATGLAVGAYPFTVTDSEGCTDSSIVSIQQPPALAMPLIQGHEFGFLSQPDTFSTPKVAGASYFWSLTLGSITSGQGSNRIIVSWNQIGNALVRLIIMDSSGCEADNQKEVGVTQSTGLDMGSAQPLFQIFPNPSFGEVYINTEGVTPGQLLAYVWLDASGRQLLSGELQAGGIMKLRTPHSPGIYLLRLMDDNRSPLGTRTLMLR